MILNSRSRQIVQRDLTIGTHQSGISGRYPIPRNGLVGEFLLNGDAKDSSGNSYDGTATNITWELAVNGYVAQNQSESGTGYTSHGDVLDFERTDSFSVSGWSKVASTKEMDIGKCNFLSGILQPGWRIMFPSPDVGLSFQLCNSSSLPTNWIYVNENNSTRDDGLWHFYTVTYNGTSSSSGVSLYVDDVLKTNNVVSNSLSATTLNSLSFSIGGFHINGTLGGAGLVGSIGLVRIYNRVLSKKEINTLYKEGLKLLH